MRYSTVISYMIFVPKYGNEWLNGKYCSAMYWKKWSRKKHPLTLWGLSIFGARTFFYSTYLFVHLYRYKSDKGLANDRPTISLLKSSPHDTAISASIGSDGWAVQWNTTVGLWNANVRIWLVTPRHTYVLVSQRPRGDASTGGWDSPSCRINR